MSTNTLSALREDILTKLPLYFEQAFPKKDFIPGQTYIPVTVKVIDHLDLISLVDASLDMWLTSGRFADIFERELPKFFGSSIKALLVNSGSSANLISISSLLAPMMKRYGLHPLCPGDEVITSAVGFPTTINPIFQNGLVPVFVDVDPLTLNPTVHAIKEAFSKKTRAVMLAHTLGNPFRADEISAWCKENNLYLIEDCCDAFGAMIGTRSVGSFGDYATLSFYPAHHMTMGEGGAILSGSSQLKRVAESMRDWGRDCWCEPGRDNTCGKRFGWQIGDLPCGYDHKYIYSNIGYNVKATDMQAALGVSQLKKVKGFIEKRRSNYQKLYQGIQNSPYLREYLAPVVATEGTHPSWFGFPLYTRGGILREKLTRYLEGKKIGTRVIFGGNLIKQPAYQNTSYRIAAKDGKLPYAEDILNNSFWIGVHPAIGDVEIAYMLTQLEEGIRESTKQ